MSKYFRVKTLMLKGEKGDTGYGISNVQMNDDYTLTVTLENGMHFNTPSIRGEKGERGACIRSVELRDDYSLLFTLDNGETLETTAILGKEFENIRKLEASASSASKIATSASTSASASAQSASQASISASESASNASTSASASAQSAINANTSASASAQSAINASQSATSAQESARSASTSADTATSKATEASTSATKAKESETNSKLSETNASNSAKEAKASADSVADVVSDVSQLKEDLPNKITKFYASNQGEAHITDSDNGKIQGMMMYGKSSQDGTPSPENPVEIKSVVNPTVKVTNEDGLKVQSVTLNNITLNAIPVSTGGNVTIDGQQYVADYIDIERGKLVRMIDTAHPKTANDMSRWAGIKENVENYRFQAKNVDNSIREGVLSNMLLANKDIWSKDISGVAIVEKDAIDFSLPYKALGINSSADAEQRMIALETWLGNNDLMFMYKTITSTEIDLIPEEVHALKELVTYYPTTNISVNSEQLDGYTVFNYPLSMANGWNYVKQQLNDNRDYIYDIDTQSAEAYVNSEYATALTELEV